MPLAEEAPSPPRSSSSAAVPHYCSSCLDGRHRDDSCQQLHMSDRFLPHTRTALYRWDFALASAGVAEEVKCVRPQGINVEVLGQEGEVAMSHWRPWLAD